MTKPIPDWRKAEEAAIKARERKLRPGERPAERISTSMDLAKLVVAIRRAFKVRQEDVARRAGVSRQWLVGFEQAKPTCEIALVFRTLEVMGVEIEIKPYEPMPPWLTRAKADAEIRAAEAQRKRLARRRTRREVKRVNKISSTWRSKIVDLE